MSVVYEIPCIQFGPGHALDFQQDSPDSSFQQCVVFLEERGHLFILVVGQLKPFIVAHQLMHSMVK